MITKYLLIMIPIFLLGFLGGFILCSAQKRKLEKALLVCKKHLKRYMHKAMNQRIEDCDWIYRKIDRRNR
tara:strand:- start:42 stop:251 length:210 start_codon:yes stop_codon:yes gene_type:complete